MDIFSDPNGKIQIEVQFEGETFWLNMNQIARLFEKDKSVISRHMRNIFAEGELDRNSTVAKNATVQMEGKRQIKREIEIYNLDAIISVGYRVNSKQGTQFRIWATQTLKEFIIKGFVLNDEMLKNGKPFGKDYFDELLERIREIRSSERRLYQKLGDIFEINTISEEEFLNTTQGRFPMILLKNQENNITKWYNSDLGLKSFDYLINQSNTLTTHQL